MAIPEKMRAWQYTSTSGGLVKNLTLSDDVPLPSLHSSRPKLLVEVISASLNPADYKIPELGLLARAVIKTPAVPGMDFSGRVVKTTPSVTNFKVGDMVFGQTDPNQYGSCGQYVVAPAINCALLPDGMDADDGASIAVAGTTAYQVIVPNVKAGDKVFINGGSGGVGTFAIQIAKTLGCFVTVSCSTGKADLCKQLGADEIIDYTTSNVSEVMKAKGPSYKLCVDNVALPVGLYKAADHFLLPDGLFSQVGGPASLGAAKLAFTRMLVPSVLGGGKRRYEVFRITRESESLAPIAKWIVEGRVKAVIEERYEFEDLPKAFEKLKGGRCYGKLVLHVGKSQ